MGTPTSGHWHVWGSSPHATKVLNTTVHPATTAENFAEKRIGRSLWRVACPENRCGI
jgi:hypothetical protein